MPELVKSLADLLAQQFNVRTTHRLNPHHTNPIINAVQPALGANPKRLGFVILNLGANPCWIAPNNRVADDYGMELVANGGSVSMLWKEEFELVALPWHVISQAAPGTNIFVMEVQIF